MKKLLLITPILAAIGLAFINTPAHSALKTSQPKQLISIPAIKQAAPATEPSANATSATSDVVAETPAAPKTCDTRQNVYCYGVYGVDQYGTPIPVVNAVQPSQPFQRSDGFYNYCELMPDGSLITVTGLIDIQPGIYYYEGPIDSATQAPAYADQSVQWCKDHAP